MLHVSHVWPRFQAGWAHSTHEDTEAGAVLAGCARPSGSESVSTVSCVLAIWGLTAAP